MNQKAIKFLGKHKLKFSDILYIIRDNNRTCITKTDHTTLDTYIPLKYLLAGFPPGCFIHINKGIAVSVDELKKIEGNIYTMSDGRSFQGRIRTAGEHNTNRQYLEHAASPDNHLISETIFQKFSVMDRLPLPFCVVEMVFNTAGYSVDYIFRYCNDAMAAHEGLSKPELLNHTYYDIFAHGDRKWLKAFSKVAIEGTPLIVDGFDEHKKVKFKIYCYQPVQNFCANFLIEEGQDFPFPYEN